MNVIEVIPDLRTDPRAKPFWDMCNSVGYIRTAIMLKGEPTYPKGCNGDFPAGGANARTIWNWIQTFRVETFDPPEGTEIRVDVDTWGLIDGGHRASALYVLNLPVPAIVIENPRKNKSAGELEFTDGMWKWK